MRYEPYHALINAIILQAVKDYRTALDDENTSGVKEEGDNTKKINNCTNTVDR